MADRQKLIDVYILFSIDKYIVWEFLFRIEHEIERKEDKLLNKACKAR
jgi:hypothetical protein